MKIEYICACILVWLVMSIIFGCIANVINTKKGYDGGFAWGFLLWIIGVIIVGCRPEKNNSRNSAKITEADEIKKYKELLDSGAITQEEYDSKKKQLLGL